MTKKQWESVRAESGSLLYAIRYAVKDYHLDFEVFEVSGETPEKQVVFCHQTGVTQEYSTDVPSKPWMHGDLKWDGCHNIYFDEQEDCMLHFCGMENDDKDHALGLLMKKIWSLGEQIPNWST